MPERPPLLRGAPESPAGYQLSWLVGTLNDRAGDVNTYEVHAHFDPRYLGQIAPGAVRSSLRTIARTHAPVELDRFEPRGEAQLVAFGEASRFPTRVWMKVDAASGKIRGFTLKPYLDLHGVDAILRMIPALAPKAQHLVGELDAGDCRPSQAIGASEPLAIASAYKLYILLALVEEIRAGRLSWTTEIAIRDEWRSESKGELGAAPAGAVFTAQEMARRMIAESDNTASDHLLFTLGRTTVEAALRSARHSDPGRNTPFPSSREVFAFRRLSREQVDRYLALASDRRRAFLDGELLATAAGSGIEPDGVAPMHVDTIGWFASAFDLCRLMATLELRASERSDGRLIAELLRFEHGNDQGSVSEADWPYLGLKSGDLPGVRNMTWLLERRDGRKFAMVHTFNDHTGREPDKRTMFALSWRLIALLGEASGGAAVDPPS